LPAITQAINQLGQFRRFFSKLSFVLLFVLECFPDIWDCHSAKVLQLMKAIIHIGLILIWLATLPGTAAQIRVTAHVTAEVVEASTLAPATHNLLMLQRDGSTENLDLGHIVISGKSAAICNVLIKTSDLQSHDGETIAFTTNKAPRQTTEVLDASGRGRIKLRATADNNILSQNHQQYAGGYNINFIYN
jgi:hypothetical protein